MNFLMILKVYLLNWISGKLNGYFMELNTTLHQMINTILKHFTKFSTLATAMTELFSQEILILKQKRYAWRVFFVSMILKILLTKLLVLNILQKLSQLTSFQLTISLIFKTQKQFSQASQIFANNLPKY